MKNLGTVLGAAIAGIFAMSVWGAFTDAYGIAGGWFAGLIIIGTMWTMNHYIGIINCDGAFVDMGLGIGVAGFIKDLVLNGAQAGMDSLPTLVLVLIGGAIGGITAQKILDSKKETV